MSKVQQKVIRATSRTADIECCSCGTIQTVERDSDGAAIDQTPCSDDSCTRRLCDFCSKFECSSCGLAHCTSHRVRIADLELCSVCVRAYVEDAVAECAEVIELAEVAA